MKNLFLSLGSLFFMFQWVNAQESAKADLLNTMIEQGIKDWKIPGLVTVVVKDGEVVFQKAYGVKNL